MSSGELAGNVVWFVLMCIPLIWLADVLGLWQRWQDGIERWWHGRR